MRQIPLTRGRFALVDDKDYQMVSSFAWFAHRQGCQFYAGRNMRLSDGTRVTQHMQTLLLKAPPGLEVMHLDGNSLDNRRKNLRAGTRLENMQGPKALRKDNTTGFRGVLPPRKGRPYFEGQIRHRGKILLVGHFATAKEAALARDDAARKLGWSEAGMNFPVRSRVLGWTQEGVLLRVSDRWSDWTEQDFLIER